MKIDYTSFNLLSVVLAIWQLPQLFVAAIVMLFALVFARDKAFIPCKNGNLSVGELRLNLKRNAPFCFSLGPIIVTPFRVTDANLKHETGHSVQSLLLGPLYLIVVAVPSVILVSIKRILHKDNDWYHSKYPENWADELAGKVANDAD